MKLFASGSRVTDNSKLFSIFFFFSFSLSVESKNRGRTFVDPKRNTELNVDRMERSFRLPG